MENKHPGRIVQLWWTVKRAVQSWFEWQDAKRWAAEYHPAWLEFATRAPGEVTRNLYRQKIIVAYRGNGYGKE